MAGSEQMKRQVCDAFGVTVAEVDQFDRELYGPEVRARRAEGERKVMMWAQEVLHRMQRIYAEVMQHATDNDGAPSESGD